MRPKRSRWPASIWRDDSPTLFCPPSWFDSFLGLPTLHLGLQSISIPSIFPPPARLQSFVRQRLTLSVTSASFPSVSVRQLERFSSVTISARLALLLYFVWPSSSFGMYPCGHVSYIVALSSALLSLSLSVSTPSAGSSSDLTQIERRNREVKICLLRRLAGSTPSSTKFFVL